MAPLPDIDEKRRATRRLIQHVKEESLRKPFTTIARDVGIHEKSVRRIFEDYLREQENAPMVETPYWLGVDEIIIKRTTRLILTNIKEETVYDLLQSTKGHSLLRYLIGLPNRHQVAMVSIGMQKSHKQAVNIVIPNARICIDKFHVLKMANTTIDEIRKNVQAQSSTYERRQLMRGRHLLTVRSMGLEEDKLYLRDALLDKFPLLKWAYELKEELHGIFSLRDRTEALELYNQWCGKIPKELKPYFRHLLASVKGWEEEVFNYFDYEITKSPLHVLSTTILEMNSRISHCSFASIRAKILLLQRQKESDKRVLRNSGKRVSNFGGKHEVANNYGVEPGVSFSNFIEILHS
jgi:transposase